MIEITNACTLLWKQESTWFFDVERKCQLEKKSGSVENVFYKALGNRFRLTSKLVSCQVTTKLFMDDLLLNGLHEKVIICYLK